MPERQLHMIRPNLDGLPDYTLPDGYDIRTYEPGDEAVWAEIMNSGIGSGWTVERCRQDITGLPQFRPDSLFFITYYGRPVGSACAWTDSVETNDRAQVHMVCVTPEHRGKSLGRIVTLAVLHYMRDHGFQEAFLGTDDFRIPAVKAYLNLGFIPSYLDESHRLRWAYIFSQIEQVGQWWRHVRPEPHSYQIREADGNRALLVLLDRSQAEAYDRACRTVLSVLFHMDIPYRVLDLGVNREPLQAINSHQSLLFAQTGLGDSLSETFARQIVKAVCDGVGFISFDHKIDRYPATLRDILPFDAAHGTLTTRAVTVPVSDHFIVRTHDPELKHRFLRPVEVTCVEPFRESRILMETDEQMPGLVAGHFDAGRVVQYLITPDVWHTDTYGHCEGLDDLFWKSIVWASRKPFVMKAMPSFVTLRVHDATGAADNFAWVRPLVEREWRPHIGVLTEEIHDAEWQTMAELAKSGHTEWFPQSLTARRAIYFHHPSGQSYSDDEVRACMAQAKARFDQHGIPIAKTLNAHRGEYGRNAIPLLTEWGVRYSLCRFLPNESLAGDHLDWESAPYGHTGCVFDDLFGFPDLFVVTASALPRQAKRAVDAARTRYTIDADILSEGGGLQGPVEQARNSNRVEIQARDVVQAMRLGLDSRYYGAITMSEQMITAFSPAEWALFLDRVDALLAESGTIRVSQDFICEYARSKVETHLASAHYDRESDTLRLTLDGKASVPLHIQVFDDECRERVIAFDAFEGRLEQSIDIGK